MSTRCEAGNTPTPGGGAVTIGLTAATILLGITAARSSVPLGAVEAPAPVVGQEASSGWPDMRIDINAADAPALTLLPGIGPTLARRIVESRRAEGPFLDHDDLQRVRGIGPKTLEGMRPYLRPMPPADAVVGTEWEKGQGG